MRSINEIMNDIQALNNSIPTEKETEFVTSFISWQKQNAEHYARLFVELCRSKEAWIKERMGDMEIK